MNGIACIGTIDYKQHVGVKLMRFGFGMHREWCFGCGFFSRIGVDSWNCSIVGSE
jgi:hypothetical protein